MNEEHKFQSVKEELRDHSGTVKQQAERTGRPEVHASLEPERSGSAQTRAASAGHCGPATGRAHSQREADDSRQLREKRSNQRPG